MRAMNAVRDQDPNQNRPRSNPNRIQNHIKSKSKSSRNRNPVEILEDNSTILIQILIRNLAGSPSRSQVVLDTPGSPRECLVTLNKFLVRTSTAPGGFRSSEPPGDGESRGQESAQPRPWGGGGRVAPPRAGAERSEAP